MIYTVHVGQRSEEWPAALPETFPTRGDAQRAARAILMHPAVSSMGMTKSEVRLEFRLLDCFSRKAASTVSVYSAVQRERGAK